MARNDFVFISGIWLGEGKITFSTSSEFIKFYTKWQIVEESSGAMKATQTVEMRGIEEQVINVLTFTDISETKFAVTLENQTVGKIQGTGLRDHHVIAWEFRQPQFEGFEVYELQENGDYFFYAEFCTPDQFRSLVEGPVRNKS